MRNAGRLKLGHYPLPVEEASNLRQLLIAPGPFFAVDPCAGDGTALLEVTKDFAAQKAAIELDADRAAASAARSIPTKQGSAFESHLPAGSCSLLYLNPPYDVEVGSHSNQRLELVFLDHCYGWLKTAGVLIFVIPNHALSPCARRLASQFERISVFRLTHPESVRFRQLAVVAIRKKEHHRVTLATPINCCGWPTTAVNFRHLVQRRRSVTSSRNRRQQFPSSIGASRWMRSRMQSAVPVPCRMHSTCSYASRSVSRAVR